MKPHFLFVLASLLVFAPVSGSRADAWDDRRIIDEEYAADLSAAAKSLRVQRLFSQPAAFSISPARAGGPASGLARYAPSATDVSRVPDGRPLPPRGLTVVMVEARVDRYERLLLATRMNAPRPFLAGYDASQNPAQAEARDELERAWYAKDAARTIELADTLLAPFPYDHQILLMKAEALACSGKLSEARIIAEECNARLQANLDRLSSSDWFKALQAGDSLERLAPMGRLKGALKEIRDRATAIAAPPPAIAAAPVLRAAESGLPTKSQNPKSSR